MAERPTTPRSMGDHDAPHATAVTPAEDVRTILINRITWGAVAAGVVISLICHVLLNMLGVGLGAATLDPATTGSPSARTFSTAAALWWAASGIIAAFVGGYAAGRLSGRPKPSTTAWHGLTTWAVTTLVIFYLLANVTTSLVSGAFNTLGSAVGGIGQVTTTVAQTVAPAVTGETNPFASIEQQLRSAAGGDDPAAIREAAVASMRTLLTGDPSQAQQAREEAASALSRALNIPPEQARERVAQFEQQYRETVERAKQQAAAAADATARAVSRASLVGFLALIVGAVAAWFGGRMGAVEPTLTSEALMRTQRPLRTETATP